jgi:ABC-2 type transport system permease protein
MRNVVTLVEREFRAYFASPIAYVVLTMFVFLSGVFFQTILGQVVEYASMAGLQAQQFGGEIPPLDVPGLVSESFMGTVSVILLFVLPMTTMGLFSEEKKRGTIELLLTLPLTDLQVVAGKFLAAMAFYTVMLGTTVVPMSALFLYGDPAWGPIASAYAGLLLYGAALLAVGLFVSTLTENQIIAGVLSFGVILLLWMVDSLAQGTTATTREVLTHLSILGHLDDFLAGVLAVSHVVFYLSLMTLGLFLTYRAVDAMRWKG